MADKTAAEKEEKPGNGVIVSFSDLEKERAVQGEVCCGGPPPPKSNPYELPGYRLETFTSGMISHEKGDVPLVRTRLEMGDHLGTLLARIGITRDAYTVSPGLYGVGAPDENSPVVVTANYKLTFDHVRKELVGVSCWLLVLDTCGINVWCAAGKPTFSTAELVEQVMKCRLHDRVTHRKLIVPQLGAPGVAAHEVKLKCGFRVVYGPVQARDLPDFIKNDLQATDEMRAVTFTLWERFVLIPVEFYLFSKKIWWIFPVIFLISGIGPEFFTLSQGIDRGLLGSGAVFFGGVLGAMVVPLLLPWIPFRSFWLKGAAAGVAGSLVTLTFFDGVGRVDAVAYVISATAVSSYLAMNFTGSTPYTSPSGVEKEMKTALPLQAAAVLVGTVLWCISPFL